MSAPRRAGGGESALADGLAEHDDGHGEELHELDGEPDADRNRRSTMGAVAEHG